MDQRDDLQRLVRKPDAAQTYVDGFAALSGGCLGCLFWVVMLVGAVGGIMYILR